jgi:hypothetical protein
MSLSYKFTGRTFSIEQIYSKDQKPTSLVESCEDYVLHFVTSILFHHENEKSSSCLRSIEEMG